MSQSDRAEARGIPPLYFLLSFLTGVAFHVWVLPLPLRLPPVGPVSGDSVRIALAAVLVVLAGALLRAALLEFARSGNDPDPHTATLSLITTGPYRWTRNPIYLGFAMLQAGLTLAVGSVWPLATALLALALMHFLVVSPEERYLERKFGEAYQEYKRRVRRWL